MSQSVDVSVVVPVKDEAGNVVPLAREIAAALAGERYEAIFVDDGSSDATTNELLGLQGEMPIRVLSHGRNLGQSRAVRTGVRAAKAPIVVTLDGDGQNDPADIPKLLAAFRNAPGEPPIGMVAGERAKREDSWKKRMASRYGNRVRRWMLSDNAKDTGCGLKVFRRDAFLELPYFDHMHRYLITLMLREGYEVRFMPVGHRPRGAGRSKYGVWDRAWVGLSDLLGVMWLKRRFRGPDTPREL
ncbi:MAG TPA: glycosyltransferase family 2 protein [Micropepsaceae bacterium]|nr:glycosyltransferase family 2 protein [Micropepsaceae bacterium]